MLWYSSLRKPENLSLSAIFFATNLKILCPILIFAFLWKYSLRKSENPSLSAIFFATYIYRHSPEAEPTMGIYLLPIREI